jgi:hypothetical protein
MTAVYDKLGLKFLYPENWTLIDESDSQNPHAITLETPDGGCSWAVHVYGVDADRDMVLKETLATLQETYEDLEVTALEDELGPCSASGVEALFYCLDFLIRAKLLVVKTRENLLLFWFQAEDREFDKQDAVFKAMAISLLQSLTPDGG